jgi:PAS domain S-box-containing protein
VDQHGKNVEQLEAELRSCRQRIAELEQSAADRNAAPHSSEEAGRAELVLFEALARESTDAVMMFNVEGIAHYLNPAALSMLGAERSGDWLGKSRDIVMAFEDPEVWSGVIEPALSSAGVWRGSVFSLRGDGSRWLMHCTWLRLLTPEGGMLGTVALCRSMKSDPHASAEHEKLHAELDQKGEELRIFKTLADHALDGVSIAGTDSIIYYANPAIRAMTGFGDRTIGSRTLDFLDEETRLRLVAEVRPALLGKGRWEGTLRLCRPDGTAWMAQGTILALRDEHGMPIAYAVIYRDVTETLQREKALRESEARHRALLEAIPDLMFLITTDEVFVDYKAESDAQLYAPPEVFLGRKLQDVLPPDFLAQTRMAMAELSRTKKLQLMEYSLVVGESKQDYEGRLVACGDNHVLLITRNITARKQAEQDRLALHAQMLEAKEATLRELATPVIPIADGVIAMPLIGAIDPVRAEQILEALLHGIASQNVNIAILDITGVKLVDAEVARALLQTAQAARLLGAEVVLTGIRPHVARTLVELGADMGGIVTRSTLKSGITYALR